MDENRDEEVPTEDLNDLKECLHLLKNYLRYWVAFHEEAKAVKETEDEDWEMHMAQYTSNSFDAIYGIDFSYEWR